MGVIDDLRANVTGEVIVPEDAAYEEARHVWNAMIDKRPRAIVRCSGIDDVVTSVNFARDNDWLVAVRGGGHNAAGLAVCDDGLVIDLSNMRSVQVDPDKKTARAQGGATWSDFDGETARHGLATTGGAISTTGGCFGEALILPEWRLDFLTSGERLLPARRGLLAPATAEEGIYLIPAPGRVWPCCAALRRSTRGFLLRPCATSGQGPSAAWNSSRRSSRETRPHGNARRPHRAAGARL